MMAQQKDRGRKMTPTLAIAEISRTTYFGLAMLSIKIPFVFSSIADAKSSGEWDATNLTPIPNLLKVTAGKFSTACYYPVLYLLVDYMSSRKDEMSSLTGRPYSLPHTGRSYEEELSDLDEMIGNSRRNYVISDSCNCPNG
jgi:hypothetical protein